MHGRSILLVDDHPSFRALARAMLENDGFDVVGEAADARSARGLAATLRPDVVLLDIHLPDGDGLEVAAELLRASSPPAVVLTSSRDESEFGPLIARSGACGFVAKAELSGAAISELIG